MRVAEFAGVNDWWMRKKGPATPTLLASKQCKDHSVHIDVVPLLPEADLFTGDLPFSQLSLEATLICSVF